MKYRMCIQEDHHRLWISREEVQIEVRALVEAPPLARLLSLPLLPLALFHFQLLRFCVGIHPFLDTPALQIKLTSNSVVSPASFVCTLAVEVFKIGPMTRNLPDFVTESDLTRLQK